MSYSFQGIALPDHLKESLDAYAQTGRPTGDFLAACISNDLCAAVGRADHVSTRCLPAIVSYLYNECPSPCWGSPEKMRDWIDHFRTERLAQEEEGARQ